MGKKKIIIFGIGNNFYKNLKMLKKEYEIIALMDNAAMKQGVRIEQFTVSDIEILDSLAFDQVVVTPDDCEYMVEQLLNVGIPTQKITVLLSLTGVKEIKETFNRYSALSYRLRKKNIQSSRILANYECILRGLPVEEPMGIKNLDDGKWEILIGKTKILLQCMGDVDSFEEIYLYKCYNLLLNRPCIVIDVGMNIGIASMFFAGNPYVWKVYAYEPFPQTFNQAVENFTNNKHLSSKILPFNIGLDQTDGIRTCPYQYERNRGANTLECAEFKSGTEVILKNAGIELKTIIQENQGKELVLKIDCEGSEYGIFRALEENHLIEKFQYILMEWHVNEEVGITDQNRQWLLKLLINRGFVCLQSNYAWIEAKGSGYLYAIKCSNSQEML